MAGICDNIILDRVLDENGDLWVGSTDFGSLDCCQPRTLEFVYKNNTGTAIRIDNDPSDTQCGGAAIFDNGTSLFTVAQVSGYATGEIPDTEEFSIFITIDPALGNCELDENLTGKFQFFPIAAGAAGCCTYDQNITGHLISHLAPTIDLGVQGNADGYLQMTQTVGSSLTKAISIRNNGGASRTYEFLQPGCWAGRFTSDFDLFTPFVLATGASQVVNITYTPTVEELDCCDLQASDDCEDPFQFTLCFEATVEDPSGPPDPPPDPDPPGGTPPCQSLVDCRIAEMGIEQLVRKSIVVDDDGCPAIRIILT